MRVDRIDLSRSIACLFPICVDPRSSVPQTPLRLLPLCAHLRHLRIDLFVPDPFPSAFHCHCNSPEVAPWGLAPSCRLTYHRGCPRSTRTDPFESCTNE